MGTLKALAAYQWGKETVRGTAVAATSKIAIPRIDFAPTDKVSRIPLAKGLLHRYPGSEVVVERGSTWTVPDAPFVFRQAQHWLSMSVKGGVSAVGAVPPYVWTYARSLTADPAPDSWTLERRLTDGASPKDTEWAYCLASEIAWKYSFGEPLMFSADGFARRVQASTLTPAMSLPTLEIPPAALALVYMDDAWANLGVTPLTAQVLGFNVAFHTGLEPLKIADARSDLDFSTYVLNPSNIGLDVDLVLLVAGQYDTEKTAAEAGTLRAMQIKLTSGTDILELDMLLKHEAGSIFKIDEQDGQDTVNMKLVDSDDSTNMFQVIVTNAINTIT